MINGNDAKDELFWLSAQHTNNEENSDQEVSFKYNSTIEPPLKKRIGKSLAEDTNNQQKIASESSATITLDSGQTVRHSKRLDPDAKFAIDTSGLSAAAQVTFDQDSLELMKARERVSHLTRCLKFN